MAFKLEAFANLLIFGVVWGGLYALVANGLNLIFGVTRILNIAHGELLMLGAYTMYWLFTIWGLSPILSVFLSAPLFFLLGIVIQSSVVYPIMKANLSMEKVERATLIVFFGVLLFIQNTALLVWSSDYRVVTYLNEPLKFMNISVSFNRILILGVALVVCLFMHFFIKTTFVGKAIRAVSQDREMGMLLGINPNHIGLLSFGLGSALAGIGGNLVGVIYVITPTMGFIFTIKSFIVMLIGGLGSTLGTLIAGICLGLIESIGSFYTGEAYKETIDYIILFSFILLVSRGYLLKGRGI